jgi:hypothetical protein
MKKLNVLLKLLAAAAFASTALILSVTVRATNEPDLKFAPAAAPTAQAATVHARGRGNPMINFGNGRDLPATDSASLEGALESQAAHPLALSSADFNEDGMPDLK